MLKTNIQDFASQIGQRIKQARLALNLSQQDIGDQLFKTGAAIGYIERGKRGVSVEDLALFAEILNVPITYFFDEKISEEQQLQDTLRTLQKHIIKLNQTIGKQAKIIDELITKLPRTEELRLINESSIDPILLIDENKTIIYATPSIYELIGIHAQKIIGMTCLDITKPTSADNCNYLMNEVFAGKKITQYEIKIMHTNGKFLDVEINAQRIEKNGQMLAHLVIRNIEARKKIERELEENKEKYKQVVKQSADGIFVTKEDLSVVEWNPAMERITGLSMQDVRGKKIWRLQAKGFIPKLSAQKFKKQAELMAADLFNKSAATQIITQPAILKRNNGKSIKITTNIFPIFLGEKKYLGGIVREN